MSHPENERYYEQQEELKEEIKSMKTKGHTPPPLKMKSQIVDENTDFKELEGTPIYYHNQEKNLSEREANERLYSSAPELLEACKLALTYFSQEQNSLAIKLGEAIAKAEGRS